MFPGTRREVHLFLLEKGWVLSSKMGSGFLHTSFRYEYVGSWFEDDFFVRKDLNTVERYFQIVCIDLVLKSFLIVSKHH